MKIIKTCLSAAISSVLIFSPMAYADKWSDQFPHIKATGDIPGDCSYEKMSKKNYKGKTLKINTHAIPVMGEPTACLLYTSPSPRDLSTSRMPSSA